MLKSQYVFMPKLVPTLATLAILPILILLGIWQLHRADEKNLIVNEYQTRTISQPLQLTDLTHSGRDLSYYPIKISGQFDNKHTILLDNKFYLHQMGYQVITPLILNNHQTILVNRGWISQGSNRQQLPLIPAVTGIQNISGIIHHVAKHQFTLEDINNLAVTWPLRIDKIDFPLLQKALGYPIYPYIILLNPDQPNGFIRNWHPAHGNPARHIAYAVQWFALALILIIIFIAVNTHKR